SLANELEMMVTQEVLANAMNDESRQAFEAENRRIAYAGDIVPLLPAMLAGAAVDQGEGSTQPTEPHHTPVDPIPSTSQPPLFHHYLIHHHHLDHYLTTTSITTSLNTSLTTSLTTSPNTSRTTSLNTSLTTSLTTSPNTSLTTSLNTSLTTSLNPS
ncbi:hypothetical protein Tco_0399160, partial [Tanacetum coccineum]